MQPQQPAAQGVALASRSFGLQGTGGTANSQFIPAAPPTLSGTTTINQPGATGSTPNSTPPAVDPNAAANAAAATAAAAKASLIDNAITYGIQGINDKAASSTSQQVAQLSSLGAGDVGYGPNGLTEQQNNIDLARRQIGTSQINSIKELMNTIHQGTQGVGVQLGNTGALDSSAAMAAARAYGNYGNVQTNSINNTASTANLAQDTAQTNLGEQINTDKIQLDKSRDSAVQSIIGEAQNNLNSLKTTIAVYLQGDPSKIPAQQIQDQIIQDAQSKLAQVDSNYQNLLNGIHPADAGTTARNAEAASNAGVIPSSGSSFQVAGAPSTLTSSPGGAPSPSLIPLQVGKPQDSLIPGA